jgi:cell division protein FtsQ
VAVKKAHKKRRMRSILWLLAAVCCIVLLVSAVYYKDNKTCKGVRVEMFGDNLNYFVNKNDVYNIVKKYGGDTTMQTAISAINLKQIEKDLKKLIWIESAELFFDNNNILKISVKESIAIARVFTNMGNSFYIDSAAKLLPVSEKLSARLPVFTGFAGNGVTITKADSISLSEIKKISVKINSDSFLMAMIEQVNILPDNYYEMIPKVGNQIIVLGEAKNVDSKFEKLKLFYKKVTPVVGWNKYSKINLQFENQIVTSLKGVEEAYSDSLKTLELMRYVAENAAIKSGDSSQTFAPDIVKKTEEKLIAQSAEREDEGEDGNVNTIKVAKPKLKIVKPTAPIVKAVVKPAITKPTGTVIVKQPIKPVIKPIVKPSTIIKKPVAKPIAKPIVKKVTKPIKK